MSIDKYPKKYLISTLCLAHWLTYYLHQSCLLLKFYVVTHCKTCSFQSSYFFCLNMTNSTLTLHLLIDCWCKWQIHNLSVGDVSSAEMCSKAKEECPVAGGSAWCTGFTPFCPLLYSTPVDVNLTKTHVAAPEGVASNIHLNRFTGWMERNTGSCDARWSVTAPSIFSYGLIISMIILRSTVKGSSSKLCVCVFLLPAIWGVLWALQSVGV